MQFLKGIKRMYVASKGYTYNTKYNWHVDIKTLEAIDGRSVISSFYLYVTGQLTANRLGSWTFYSHHKLNKDILDTLRAEFAPKPPLRLTINGKLV